MSQIFYRVPIAAACLTREVFYRKNERGTPVRLRASKESLLKGKINMESLPVVFSSMWAFVPLDEYTTGHGMRIVSFCDCDL